MHKREFHLPATHVRSMNGMKEEHGTHDAYLPIFGRSPAILRIDTICHAYVRVLSYNQM